MVKNTILRGVELIDLLLLSFCVQYRETHFPPGQYLWEVSASIDSLKYLKLFLTLRLTLEVWIPLIAHTVCGYCFIVDCLEGF